MKLHWGGFMEIIPPYTVFHWLVVEVSWVLDYASCPGQKQNTPNFYHKQMKDGVGRFHGN